MSPLTTAQAIAAQAASSSQGALADTALQPDDIGSSVQAYSANLGTLAGVVPGSAGTSILALSSTASVRNFLSASPYVSSRTNLKAIDTTLDGVCFLTESGREGVFIWRTGDYSTQIAADTAEGVYIKANAIAATSGAWVRQFEGVQDIRWFGGVAGGATDNAAAFIAANSLGGKVYIPDGTFLVNLTNGNFDAIARNLFLRCIGPGLIDAVVPIGVVTAASTFAIFNNETCRINIRGTILQGALTTANIAITGSNGAYSAAITFPALPANITVGQLLSIASTDRTVPAVLICGALKITNIVGNVVTVALPYTKGTFAPPPASLSFTGPYVLAQSIINYTQFRTIFAVTSDDVKLSISSLGMTGPYTTTPLSGVNTVAISIGIKDQTEELCNSTVKVSDVLINGFNYGILGLGGSFNIQRPHIGACAQGVRFVRGHSAYMTNVRIGNNADSGIHIDALSKAVHDGEGMSCGNGGRGVWSFTGGWYSSGAFETSYNSVGTYGKNGAVMYEAPNSRARFNDGIGFGNENSFVNLISTFSLDNRVTGYEIGAGGFTDLTNSVSLRNEQSVYALINAGAECAGVEAGYSTGGSGFVAAEGSIIRAKNANSHHNIANGYSAIGESHIRCDAAVSTNNTGYGYFAQLNSNIRLMGATATANTAGATSADATSQIS